MVLNLNTTKKSSAHFEHLIISLITETTMLPKSSYQNDNLIQRAQYGRFNVRTLIQRSSRIHFESDHFNLLICSWDKMTCFSVGQNDQLIFIGDKVLIFFTEEEETNWNQVLKMGTWSEPSGLGQNDPDHFSTIKDCVYSAFWAFRYVRAYGGWCVHSSGRWTSRSFDKSTDKICPLILSHPSQTSIVQDQVVILTTWLQGLD